MGRPQDVFVLFDYSVKEDAYGTPVPDVGITDWQKLTSPGLAIQTQDEDTDQDEISGHPYVSATGPFIHSKRTRASLEFKAGVDFVIFVLASLFGNVASVAPTNFTHPIKWPGSGVDGRLSTSVIQATNRAVAATKRKFNGVFCNSFEMNLTETGDRSSARRSSWGMAPWSPQPRLTPPLKATSSSTSRPL